MLLTHVLGAEYTPISTTNVMVRKICSYARHEGCLKLCTRLR
jgi:hypothetical protein